MLVKQTKIFRVFLTFLESLFYLQGYKKFSPDKFNPEKVVKKDRCLYEHAFIERIGKDSNFVEVKKKKKERNY